MLEEAEEEEEVREEAGCLEAGQGAEAGLCKAELSCRKELTVKSESQGQLVEVWDKKEDGGAGREPSLSHTIPYSVHNGVVLVAGVL